MEIRIRRRDLFALLAATALAPAGGSAQQQKTPVLGLLLSSGKPDREGSGWRASRKGLSEWGFTEGRNLAVEERSAEGRYDRLPDLATDLVRRKVDVIFAGGGPAAAAAKAATADIPIVFWVGIDPVAAGLVKSLSHPGGNLTGVTIVSALLLEKRLQLLHELLPSVRSVGYLTNPRNPFAALNDAHITAAAAALGISVRTLPASSVEEIQGAFSAARRRGVEALITMDDPLFGRWQTPLLVNLSARHAIPVISSYTQFATRGGLASYSANGEAMAHQVGDYLGRILKGAKPADLPVQEPARFELVINLKTAKALRLTIPSSVLARADEIIE